MGKWVLVFLTLFGPLVTLANPPEKESYIEPEAAKKLEAAFGPKHLGVRNAKFKFRVNAGSPGGSPMYFGCGKFEIEPNGWVKMTPFYEACWDPPGSNLGRLGGLTQGPCVRFKMDPPVKGPAGMSKARWTRIVFEGPDHLDDFGKAATK